MKKRVIIVIAVLVLILLLILLLLIKPKTKPVTEGQLQTPEATITPFPTSTPRPDQLSVVKILPLQNAKEPYVPIQKITIVFSDPILPPLVKFETDPKTEVEVKKGMDAKTIYLIPQSKWQLGATTITILQATRAINGKPLATPVTYKIITDNPKGPDPNIILP